MASSAETSGTPPCPRAPQRGASRSARCSLNLPSTALPRCNGPFLIFLSHFPVTLYWQGQVCARCAQHSGWDIMCPRKDLEKEVERRKGRKGREGGREKEGMEGRSPGKNGGAALAESRPDHLWEAGCLPCPPNLLSSF